jgi:septal ring factor EnvC (AmiA/AmiB activator)
MPPGKRASRASTATNATTTPVRCPGLFPLPQAHTDCSLFLLQSSSKTHDLELQYQQACHQVELVAKDEEARRMKLQILQHRDENAALQDSVAQKDASIDQLSEKCHQAREGLEQSRQQCLELEKKLRMQTRDHANLKVCPACEESFVCIDEHG